MSARYYWTVEVETTSGSGTYTVVPNVQALTVNYGRTQPTDDFPAGQISISGILPDSLPSNFRSIGALVQLKLYQNNATLLTTFYCRTRSLSRTYGTKPNLDTWTFNGLGDIGRMAEQQLTNSFTTTAGNNTTQELSDLLASYGIGNSYIAGDSFISGTTFTTSTYLNDIAQTLIRTEQGRLIDVITSNGINILSRSYAVSGTALAYFNDLSLGTFGDFDVPYTSVEFLNTGEYKASTVVVEPDGLADQVSGSGRPVLNFASLDQTTSQAANLAGYIKNTLDLNVVRPLSVTVLADAQINNTAVFALYPSALVRLILRGTSYDCVVEGVSIQANPSATQFTYHLSSADAYKFLRLNDAVFGKLDQNRLGF
jgi:hypothetical protein